MKNVWLIAAALAAAGCSTPEFGYADVVDGHRSLEQRPDADLDPVQRARRVLVRVTIHRIPAAAVAEAGKLEAFEDPNARVTGQDVFARNGMRIFVTRPGVGAVLAERLERLQARSGRRSGFVEQGQSMAQEIGPSERRALKVAQPANGGAATETIEFDAGVVEVFPLETPAGGVQVRLVPHLRRVGDQIRLWTLPELSAETLVDAHRSVLMLPSGGPPDRFGSAFLGTAGGDILILEITASMP